MQNTKNMHLKLSSVGQNWPQVAPSWRQVGPEKSTKFDKWPQVGAKLAPNGAKLASKLSQDLQMTPQRAPKEPPKTPLDGPKPSRNRSKRCFRHKKKIGQHSPLLQPGFCSFSAGSGKNCSVCSERKDPHGNTPKKGASDMPKKIGGHSTLFKP